MRYREWTSGIEDGRQKEARTNSKVITGKPNQVPHRALYYFLLFGQMHVGLQISKEVGWKMSKI